MEKREGEGDVPFVFSKNSLKMVKISFLSGDADVEAICEKIEIEKIVKKKEIDRRLSLMMQFSSLFYRFIAP